jgi:hypothetical protein
MSCKTFPAENTGDLARGLCDDAHALWRDHVIGGEHERSCAESDFECATAMKKLLRPRDCALDETCHDFFSFFRSNVEFWV